MREGSTGGRKERLEKKGEKKDGRNEGGKTRRKAGLNEGSHE